MSCSKQEGEGSDKRCGDGSGGDEGVLAVAVILEVVAHFVPLSFGVAPIIHIEKGLSTPFFRAMMGHLQRSAPCHTVRNWRRMQSDAPPSTGATRPGSPTRTLPRPKASARPVWVRSCGLNVIS